MLRNSDICYLRTRYTSLMETKKCKCVLLGTLAVSVLGSALTGRGVIRASECTIRASQKFNATSSFN